MSETFSEWVRRHADQVQGDGDRLLCLMADEYEYCVAPGIFEQCDRVAEDVELMCGKGGRHVAYAVAMTATDLLHAIYEEVSSG